MKRGKSIISTRGLYKLHGAAQTAQARWDYQRLVALAQSVKRSTAVPSVKRNAGWRTLDAAAKIGVERLLNEFPYLHGKLREIYPGLVPEDGTLTIKK